VIFGGRKKREVRQVPAWHEAKESEAGRNEGINGKKWGSEWQEEIHINNNKKRSIPFIFSTWKKKRKREIRGSQFIFNTPSGGKEEEEKP